MLRAATSPALDVIRPQLSTLPVKPAVSTFPPGSPAGQLAAQLQQRLDAVRRGVQPNYTVAVNALQQLSTRNQQLLQAVPPELRSRLDAQLRRDTDVLRQGLGHTAGSVSRPFTPAEARYNLGQSAARLRESINQTFAAFHDYTRYYPAEQRGRISQALSAEYARVLGELQPHLDRMASSSATPQTVMASQQAISSMLSRLDSEVGRQLLSTMPVDKQALARADFGLRAEARNHALYNVFSSALQPTSPTDVSKLPGAPPMQGPLSPAQATQVLGRLEQLIQAQFQQRMRLVDTLPAPRRAAALFDAQAQRDRMLVNAYQNVLGRLTQPAPLVRPPVRPPVDTF